MKVIFFDTETDNLIPNSIIRQDKKPRVMEIYGLLCEPDEEQLNELDFLNMMFNIERPIDAKASQITGITDDDLKNSPVWKDGAEAVRNFLSRADRVVAHNASFDTAVIDCEMDRFGLPRIAWPEIQCTVEATEYLFGYRLNLNALHKELFGEEFKGAHRAESDVRALANCWHKLYKMGNV